MWTLEAALETVRPLEAYLKMIGWHVALGGGVLHRGASTHDLDLILVPHSTHTSDQDALERALAELTYLGWRRIKTVDEMHAAWRAKGSNDTKHVEVWLDAQGRRVDFIRWPLA